MNRLGPNRDHAEFIDEWVFSRPLAQLLEAFEETPPDPAEGVRGALERLDAFSERWDFRQGRERNQAEEVVRAAGIDELVVEAAKELGLDDVGAPALGSYDHVLILGGLARGCLARPMAAAALLKNGLEAGRLFGLAAFRETNEGELAMLDALGLPPTASEFETMTIGIREAFGLSSPDAEDGGTTDSGTSWRAYRYSGPGGLPIEVVAVPDPAVGRRPRTGDSYRWLADRGSLQAGQTALIVTTAIYRVYQLADAIRELELGRQVMVDAVGMRPGDVDARLLWPEPAKAATQYLLELRSTIRALRALETALGEPR